MRIVEPERYAPVRHAELFNAALSAALGGRRETIDLYSSTSPPRDRFDLIVFPEAFLPACTLVDTLAGIARAGPTGCIHTGLRPSGEARDGHLFTGLQLRGLVAGIRDALPHADVDLAGFARWLARRTNDARFNVGALFLNDASGRTRVCLHPKLVRSRFETSALVEDHMEEADLLTLVTLRPTRADLGTVTIQPLICSDALNLSTDDERGPPMAAVHRYARCLGDAPPDHVDIVSVATCTPQAQGLRKGRPFRVWHERFQEAFLAAARDPAFGRHHFASIVLANFLELDGGKGGGLSGVFLPLSPDRQDFGDGISISAWGRPRDGGRANNAWSEPLDDAVREWTSRGFVAGLDPFAGGVEREGRMLSADIQRLPRERSILETSSTACLTRVEVLAAFRTERDVLHFAALESEG